MTHATLKGHTNDERKTYDFFLENIKIFSWLIKMDKIPAQPYSIVKQICFSNGNVLFLSLCALFKNWMHNVVWGCAEMLPF